MNPYPSYKESGIEWIGEIPCGWLVSRLDFLCLLKGRLGWKSLKSDEYVDDGFIFLSTPNLKNKDIDYQNVNYITEERYLESPEIILENDDVLLVKDGSTLGIVNIVKNLPRPSTVNSSIGVLKNKSELLESNFLYYFLSSYYCQNIINRIKGGMGVPHLFQSDIKKFVVLLPKIQEQQQISNYLDHKTQQIDSLIDKTQQKIELLKEQRTSLINQCVTKGLNPNVEMKDSGVEWIGEIPKNWEIKKIKYVMSSIGGGTPSKDKEEYWNGSIPWVSPKDMKKDIIDLSEDYITEVGLQNSSTNLITSQSVLVVFRSGILKHSIPLGINVVPVTINQDMKSFTSKNNKITNKYFYYFIKGNQKNLLLDWSKEGTTVESLETEFVENFKIPCPSIEIQNIITQYLDKSIGKIENNLNKETKRLELLKEYRESMISNVVTGKVDVTNESI